MEPKYKPLPLLSILLDRFEISGENLLYRKSVSWNSKKGKLAGKVDSRGYGYVTIKGATYLVHRIVYAISRGKDPVDFEIDHIDGNKQNNRPENLRACAHSQNQFNRQRSTRHNATTKVRNVRVFADGYRVRITKNGKTFISNKLKTLQEAVELARTKRREMFGDFAGADDFGEIKS